jgi:Fe-S oxidoreductase
MDHKVFRADLCTRCGECFTRCHYMDLTRAQAVAEIDRLIAGQPSPTVHKKCVSCYACNAFCPVDAHPYELILEAWHERYLKSGLPARASYLMPYHSPNYREDMEAKMSGRERALLARWKSTPAAGEVLYPGCNLLTVPYLFDLDVLSQLPVSGDWSLCCGEPFFRGGMFEPVAEIANGLTRYYADKQISKMVFVCPACMNMFRNVLPQQFGAKLDFECEYIVTWLLRKMDSGELKITRPLNRTVAVHDSCHGRVLRDEIMGPTRELYRRLGLKIVELKLHHEDGLCCGIAAGLNKFMPQDITLAAARELRQSSSSSAQELAIYCTGCYLMLNIANHVVFSRPPLVHTLEYLAEAVGQPAPRTVVPRTRSILLNVIAKAFPAILSRDSHHPANLQVGKKD